MKFDITLLQKIISNDRASLIGKYNILTRDTNIEFICNCGNTYIKNFRLMYISSGAFCRICTVNNRRIKLEKTCMERFGVINPFQNKDIIENIKDNYIKKYNVDHPSKIQTVKDKKVEKSLKQYGVKNVFQSDIIKNKIKDTNQRKYGCNFIAQNKDIKSRMDATLFKNYGVKSPLQNSDIQARAKNTCFKNHGVEYSFQSSLIREKSKKTSQEKYGCDMPCQNINIYNKLQKNAFSCKKYILPSGKVWNVRGFEPYALDELLKFFTEEEIKVKPVDIPRIEYIFENKKHYYFPDIYIPKENKIIEVKSTWTYKLKPKIIKAKGDMCKEKGYNYEIWIYDNKKNKTLILF
jgi:hypothetical protein